MAHLADTGWRALCNAQTRTFALLNTVSAVYSGMLSSWWFGALLGSGLVAASSLVRGLSHRQALDADSVSDALYATVRGILWRAGVILAGLVLTLLLLPVHAVAFASALSGCFLLSLLIEMTVVWKRTDRP